MRGSFGPGFRLVAGSVGRAGMSDRLVSQPTQMASATAGMR